MDDEDIYVFCKDEILNTLFSVLSGMIVDWTDKERDNAAEEIGYGDVR